MKNKMSSKTISLIFSVMVICFAISFNVFGWTEPTADPPADNVSAPLNASIDSQLKSGGLIINTGGATTGLIVDKGNVGIGTTNPSHKLEVDGISDVSVWIAGGDSTHNSTLKLGHSSDRVWSIIRKGYNAYGNSLYDLEIGYGGTSYGGNILLNPTNGNVGIGTTAPSEKLDVAGNIYASGTICDSTGKCIGDGGSSLWTESASGLDVYRSSGNVGIGTTEPNAKLDVAGDIYTTKGKILNNATDPSLNIRANRYNFLKLSAIENNSNTEYPILKSAGQDLWLYAGNNVRATIKSNGNVGIGTTTPGTSKLKVEGGPIEAAGGFILQTCTDGVNCPNDTGTPVDGQMWLAQ